MASVDPGASAATWRSVAAIASLVRYMLTPVDATTAGWPASKPATANRCHQGSPASKSTGNEPQPLRDAEAELDQTLSLPGLRAGLVDLEHEQAGGDLRPALGEGVQARSEDDVLADTVAGLFHDQILDEAGTGHDGGAELARGMRIHVRTATPAFVRGRQPQANFVFEHMRRRIDLDVQWPATRRPAPPCCLPPRFARPARCSLAFRLDHQRF